jgi:aerobic carbon-monoxide dehydrogenase small subunit
MTVPVSATVNGSPFAGEVPAEELLLDFLRDRLGLAGVRQSCEVQVCGVCTVLVDGDPVSSCCYLAADIDDRSVETIEGLVGTEFHERAVDSFVRHAAVQCGFCTPGMVLTAKALRQRGLTGRHDIAVAMNGNLCRCTGYESVLDSLCDLLATPGTASEAGAA